MNASDANSRPWSLLSLALAASVSICSIRAEGLVLHQHGARWTHLHVLGHGDLSSNAARSSSFGHSSNQDPTMHSNFDPVRIIAVVTTGLTYLTASNDGTISEATLRGLPIFSPVSASKSSESSRLGVEAVAYPASVGGTASTMILLRNHALLL